jgi:hypothetical protein
MLRSVWDAAVAAVISKPLWSQDIRPDVKTWHLHVRKRIGQIAETRGVECSVAEMKNLATECRRAWVTNTPPKHWALRSAPRWIQKSQNAWAQLSMLGRALPTGSERHARQALASHKESLLSEFVTSPEDLKSLKSYAEGWARKYLPRNVEWSTVAGIPQGVSATYDCPRDKGGLTRSVSEALAFEPAYYEPHDEMPEDWQSLIKELELVGSTYSEEWPLYPKGRVVTIEERGHKVRIVTAMQRYALVLGHLARRRLALGLQKWSLTKHVREGEPRKVGADFVGAQGHVLSADLTSASDLIPLDVAKAIVDGFEDSERFLPAELDGLRLGTGPIEVTWPDGETKVTKRGILMGLPTTWSILCIYHGWAWQQALLANHGPVARQAVARICGDDLLGIATPWCLDAYESAMTRTGAKFSKGKHFRSRSRGVFLEVLWDFAGTHETLVDGVVPVYKIVSRGKGGQKNRIKILVNTVKILHVNRVRAHHSMPLKGLVVGDAAFGHGAPEAPDWWLAGVAETDYLRHFRRRTVHAVSRTLRRRLPAVFEKFGVPAYLPRELGGAGLAGPARLRVPPSHRRALATLLYGQTSHLTSFERVWRDAPANLFDRSAAKQVDADFSTLVTRLAGLTGPPDWVPLGDPEEIRQSSIRRISSDMAINFGVDGSSLATKYPPIQEVCRRICKVRSRILESGWLSARGVCKSVPVMVARWRELRSTLVLWIPLFVTDEGWDAAPDSLPRYNPYLVEPEPGRLPRSPLGLRGHTRNTSRRSSPRL